MKFDPFSWNEVNPNEEIQARKGWLRVRASAPCPLYVQAEGYEALVGVATSFDVELSAPVSFRVEAPEGTRVFHHNPHTATYRPTGEVFTNIDRMPHESGAVAEVRSALRQLELQKRSILRDIRAERLALESARANSAPAADPAPADPAPADPAPADPAPEGEVVE